MHKAHEHHPEDTTAAQFWDSLYRERDRMWSGRVNSTLADFASDLPAGTVLDLGCAEGGDAVWLAARGWQVTAVDVSATALERATAAAAAAEVSERIDFRRVDLTRSFPTGTFDLVSAQFLQSPIDFPRDGVLRDAAAAVAVGGLLLITDHGSVPPWSRHMNDQPVFPTAEETRVAIELDSTQWREVFVGSRDREAIGPDGQRASVADSIVALRRVGA